jgi:hypothetical protein
VLFVKKFVTSVAFKIDCDSLMMFSYMLHGVVNGQENILLVAAKFASTLLIGHYDGYTGVFLAAFLDSI